MAASSGACFFSPKPSPKVHDCRPHPASASHALAPVVSPTQGRVPIPFSSPTSRRPAGTCSALPFGFPSFGFPPFGFPAGSGQAARAGANSSGSDVEWVRGGGGAAAGGAEGQGPCSGSPAAGSTQVPAGPAQQQSARRRLNLSQQPQSSSPAQATMLSSATITTIATATCDEVDEQLGGGWPAPDSTDDTQDQLQQREGATSSPGVRRGGSPLPYPWRLSDEENETDGCGGTSGDGWVEGGIAGGSRGAAGLSLPVGDLDVRQLTELLAQLRSHDVEEYDSDVRTNARGGGGGSWLPTEPRPRPRTPRTPSQRRRHLQQRQALLDQLHSGLVSGRLQPGELLRVPGLLPFVNAAVAAPGAVSSWEAAAGDFGGTDRWQHQVPERGVSASAGVALECLCTLLSEDNLPALACRPEVEGHLKAAVEAAVAVLAAARLPSAVSAPGQTSHGAFGDSLPDGTADAYEWSSDVSAAFFAASVLVRASRVPALAEAAVMAGGLGLLVKLMGCRPAMLAQIAIFATYKLVRQPPPLTAAPASVPSGPGVDGNADEQRRRVAEREREWRDAALLAVAQAGGMGALCSCLETVEDRPSRDMASSLMLDMAIVPQVPAVVAGLNQVAPLVAVMSSRRCDHVARMYGLLVLARLCNHSAECQMDAVREGALEPLMSLIRRGGDDEQTHACRLLAILAQAVPTHGRIKAMGVVQVIIPLLRGARGPGIIVAEHAMSFLMVLSQNPDMHFHIVGCGAVPAMVPLLSSGTEKTRTYVLSVLMLLCEQEERHAAVVVRTGALPLLVAMAGQRSVAATAMAPPAAAAAGPHSSQSAAVPPARSVATIQEFAAAVLCCLSRYVDVQAELISCGALPALVRCLGQGPAEAAINAAEALVHLAAGDADAKRAIGGDAAAAAALLLQLSSAKPSARYWALQLVRAVSTDDEALHLMAGLPPGSSHVDTRTEVRDIQERRSASAASFGLWLPALAAAAAAAAAAASSTPPSAVLRRGRGGATMERAAALVAALVALLRWPEGPGAATWQQGRCRVLAAWLLARLCGVRQCGPLLVAGGAVRELMAVLAQEQERTAAIAAASAAAVEALGDGAVQSLDGDASSTLPLLPGEGAEVGVGDGDDPSNSDGSDASVAWPDLMSLSSFDAIVSGSSGVGVGSGGAGLSSARRMRFDGNAGAAATAALLAVARLGPEGLREVLSEITLRHWMGTAVRLDELERM